MNKEQKDILRCLISWVVTIGVTAAVVVFLVIRTNTIRASRVREATIESGSTIELSLFDDRLLPATSFITDVSMIDTTVPAVYGLVIDASGYEVDCILNIVDTTPPQGEAVRQEVFFNCLPPAEDCVTDIRDLAPVSISYLEEDPDISQGGEYPVQVKLEDLYGNVTIIDVPFSVTVDDLAPFIYGPHDIEQYAGDPIVYRNGLCAYDDYDPEPVITIDNSAVDPEAEGVYPVYYIAEDRFGNTRTMEITVTLHEKPEGYIEPEVTYALAQEILDEITTDDMSDIEKAMCAIKWTINNIWFINEYSNKVSWTTAAYDGFNTRYGDCFTCYSCVKAFLDILGFDNLCVERYPATNMHWWNLVCFEGRWYHCDATPFEEEDGSYLFLCTDAELGWSHQFDSSLYPPRATESVQYRIDYDNMTVAPAE